MNEPVRALLASLTSGFTELPGVEIDSAPDGPIGWSGYGRARATAADRTGERDSVVCGVGTIGDSQAVLIGFEFGFLGGSIGEATGHEVERAFQHAVSSGLPVVSLISTGGSRMQEGMRALTQLHRLAHAAAVARRAGVPQIAVLREPTTGGGWATLGAGGDVVLALTGVQVGFAGSRVRPAADERAYTAEAHFESGQVDQLVRPENLRSTLAGWLRLLTMPYPGSPSPPRALGVHRRPPTTGWDAVARARAPERPRAQTYLDDYFAWRHAISGDRVGGVDHGVECGIGWREGGSVAYAAQTGTATRPAGFRTAARLVRFADRLGIPVLTLVDTPGAANDGAAEHTGVGPAIAELFEALASTRLPATTLLIGEGGSGGALAFAARDRLWATPDSYFSVTSPEAAASILKRPEAAVPTTADQLHLRPQDLLDLGIARGIVGP